MARYVKSAGFTLIELAVVVVIIGVLAAFAVPKFLDTIERSKAAEAFNFLSAVQAAEERYHARQGRYADEIASLDVEFVAPKYFEVGDITADETSWSEALTRKGASGGYGNYSVVYTREGFDLDNSTIAPQISPMQTEP